MIGDGPPEEEIPAVHRSLADGDLHTAWSVEDFFGSLNGVLLLPPKRQKRSTELGGRTIRFRLPTGAVVAMFILSFCVLAGGRFLATRSGNGAPLESLAPALGVWKATNGRYAGRLFTLSDSVVAFSTSAAGGFSLHPIERVRTAEMQDSTLFTVTYREGSGTSDFAFWLYPRRGTIQFKNVSETVWTRAESGSQPRSTR